MSDTAESRVYRYNGGTSRAVDIRPSIIAAAEERDFGRFIGVREIAPEVFVYQFARGQLMSKQGPL